MAHNTFTLTGKHTTPSGTAHRGSVTVTPNAVLRDAEGGVVLAGPAVAQLDAAGAWTLTLPCDGAGLVPASGIGYTITYQLAGVALVGESFAALEALTATTVDVAEIVTVSEPLSPPTTVIGSGGVVADATASTKGVVRLAGDLGGTASTPTVPGLAGKSDNGHTHVTGDVTGLDADLAAKADTGHTHTTADVTGLDADLAAKADTGHTHTSADVSDFTEAAQDVVGGMIAAAGGTYDDTAGTVTLPAAGGGTSAVLAAVPAVGKYALDPFASQQQGDKDMHYLTSLFYAQESYNIDRVAFWVSTAGAAGASLTVTAHPVNADGTVDVGVTLFTAGTIGTTATGLKELSGAWTLPQGHFAFRFSGTINGTKVHSKRRTGFGVNIASSPQFGGEIPFPVDSNVSLSFWEPTVNVRRAV